MEVESDQVSSYGCAAIEQTDEDDVVRITDLVEKPAPEDAPSNWIIIGRYVCDPAVFGVLEHTPPGRGGEIQLTDALKTLAQTDPADGGGVYGVLFRGRRYDTGNKVDYLRTLVQFACERPDVAPEFVPWLRKYVDNLPMTHQEPCGSHADPPLDPRRGAPGRGARGHPPGARRSGSRWPRPTAACWPRTSRPARRCRRSTTRPWTATRSGPPTWPAPAPSSPGHAAGARRDPGRRHRRTTGSSRAPACGS